MENYGISKQPWLANGKEALESLIISYLADGEPLPEPSTIQAA